MAAKYWLAGNPNAEVSNAEVTELATISETDFGVLSDLTNSAANLNAARDSFSASTAISADATLAVNTLYHVTDTGDSTYALPAASSSVKGDQIVVRYDAIIANTNIHDYGTAGEFYATWSRIYKMGTAATGGVYTLATAPNGSSNDYLKLTGASNGGPGLGTHLTFTFDGSNWGVNGVIMKSGTGAVAPTAAFADTEG
jgi:hypothetical protein